MQVCSDAHTALKSPANGEPIEIVIGGWVYSQSCIWRTPQGEYFAINLERVLNCREYCSFTVYWGDGQILVKKENTTVRKSSMLLSLPLNSNLCDVTVGMSTECRSSGSWVFEGISVCLANMGNNINKVFVL